MDWLKSFKKSPTPATSTAKAESSDARLGSTIASNSSAATTDVSATASLDLTLRHDLLEQLAAESLGEDDDKEDATRPAEIARAPSLSDTSSAETANYEAYEASPSAFSSAAASAELSPFLAAQLRPSAVASSLNALSLPPSGEEEATLQQPQPQQPQHKMLRINPNEMTVPCEARQREEQNRRQLERYQSICSAIIPGLLYVSGDQVAADRALLEECGITDVINMAGPQIENYFERQGISYLRLNVYDVATEQMEGFLYRAFDTIAQVQARGGRVLIHCSKGVSRSCSVAIGWLMWVTGMQFSEACQQVTNRRSVCQPNPGFQCFLVEWEKRRARLPSLLYRIGYHLPHFPQELWLKACLEDSCRAQEGGIVKWEALNSHSCFLILAPNKRVVIWKGKHRAEGMLELAREAARWLLVYEAGEDPAVGWVEEEEGKESAEFWSLVPSVGGDGVNYVDLIPPKDTAASVMPGELEGTNESMARPEDQEQTGSSSNRPQLLECERAGQAGGLTWRPMGVYDNDDLLPDGRYLLVCTRPAAAGGAGNSNSSGATDPESFLWLGGESGTEAELLGGEGIGGISCDGIDDEELRQAVASIQPASLVVAREGHEPERFWELFESGY
ncbi:unnamed protein product [Chrysoparadoxa australica]